METLDFGCEVPKAGSFEIVEDQPEPRPPCPECGSNHIHSWGRFQWSCYDCGRRFLRKYRRKPIIKKRPPCPECKSNKIVSNGMSWHCNNCGKNWIKTNRKFTAL